MPPLFLYMYVCAPGSERKSRGECLCLVCIAKGSTHDHVMLELACAAERGLVRCELCAYFYTGYSVPTTVSRILYIAYGYAVSAISAARRSRMHRNCKAANNAPKLDHVRVLTGEWPPRGPKTRFCSRACPPHRGRSAWWPRTSAAVSDVARLHVGLSSMKATEREVAELSAGISAAGREEVLLERDKITKDALSAGRRRPTGRQLLSRCTPLTHRSRSSIAHRV